jgi:hypothetical protein
VQSSVPTPAGMARRSAIGGQSRDRRGQGGLIATDEI